MFDTCDNEILNLMTQKVPCRLYFIHYYYSFYVIHDCGEK